jgi:tetratricopeptide (TPR) repeat protein
MKTNKAFLEGQRHFLRGEYARSIMGFGNALETGMDATKVHVPLGLAYFKNGNFTAAAEEFSHALERDPTNDHLLFLRGMTWFNSADLDKALADFDLALRFNPRRSMPLIARSLVFRAIHRDREADDDLKSALGTGGVEVELFIREYCLSPVLQTLARTLFDVTEADWGLELRTGGSETTH